MKQYQCLVKQTDLKRFPTVTNCSTKRQNAKSVGGGVVGTGGSSGGAPRRCFTACTSDNSAAAAAAAAALAAAVGFPVRRSTR